MAAASSSDPVGSKRARPPEAPEPQPNSSSSAVEILQRLFQVQGDLLNKRYDRVDDRVTSLEEAPSRPNRSVFSELKKLRQQLEEATSQKNQLLTEVLRLAQKVDDLEGKLNSNPPLPPPFFLPMNQFPTAFIIPPPPSNNLGPCASATAPTPMYVLPAQVLSPENESADTDPPTKRPK